MTIPVFAFTFTLKDYILLDDDSFLECLKWQLGLQKKTWGSQVFTVSLLGIDWPCLRLFRWRKFVFNCLPCFNFLISAQTCGLTRVCANRLFIIIITSLGFKEWTGWSQNNLMCFFSLVIFLGQGYICKLSFTNLLS